MGGTAVSGSVRLGFDATPSQAAIVVTRERWRESRRHLTSGQPVRPFIVITPLGMPMRDRIQQALARAGVTVAGRRDIPDWPTASTLLYAKSDGDERLTVALAFEALWRAVVLDRRAQRWDLAGRDDLARAITAKPALHEQLGIVRVHLGIPGVTMANDGVVRLRALHMPDVDRVDDESRLLDGIVP